MESHHYINISSTCTHTNVHTHTYLTIYHFYTSTHVFQSVKYVCDTSDLHKSQTHRCLLSIASLLYTVDVKKYQQSIHIDSPLVKYYISNRLILFSKSVCLFTKTASKCLLWYSVLTETGVVRNQFVLRMNFLRKRRLSVSFHGYPSCPSCSSECWW